MTKNSRPSLEGLGYGRLTEKLYTTGKCGTVNGASKAEVWVAWSDEDKANVRAIAEYFDGKFVHGRVF